MSNPVPPGWFPRRGEMCLVRLDKNFPYECRFVQARQDWTALLGPNVTRSQHSKKVWSDIRRWVESPRRHCLALKTR
jgi:hypothetical protein